MNEQPEIQAKYEEATALIKRLEYTKAADCYKAAAGDIIALIRADPAHPQKAELMRWANFFMDQSEYCQNYLDPVRRQQVHDAELFASVRQPAAVPSRPLPTSPRPGGPTEPSAQPRQGGGQQQTGSENEYEQHIMNEILDSSTSVQWSDIAGLENAKFQMQEAIIKPALYPHIYTGIRAPPKGILLFGPPGTGKTMLAKAVASESKACFLTISSAALTSKFFGEAEKLVRAMFSVARKRQPSVVFIDELDSILSSRSEGQHEASRRLQTEFLVQMDGVRGDSEERVIVIGATNRPQEIDEAVRRRFPKRILVDLPNDEARRRLVEHLMEKVFHQLSNEDLVRIVQRTEFYSGSDLAALCKEAAMAPVRSLTTVQMERGEVPPVVLASFEEALHVIRPSVSRSHLAFYHQWNDEFGSN